MPSQSALPGTEQQHSFENGLSLGGGGGNFLGRHGTWEGVSAGCKAERLCKTGKTEKTRRVAKSAGRNHRHRCRQGQLPTRNSMEWSQNLTGASHQDQGKNLQELVQVQLERKLESFQTRFQFLVEKSQDLIEEQTPARC
jgi:hypothetical protein